MAYRMISDPGHGWLEVPRSLLAALGIANAISPYSYVRGNMAYLEEDCDYSLFLEVYRREHGHDPEIAEHPVNHEATIRRYARYPLDPAWQVHAVAARSPRPGRPLRPAPSQQLGLAL